MEEGKGKRWMKEGGKAAGVGGRCRKAGRGVNKKKEGMDRRDGGRKEGKNKETKGRGGEMKEGMEAEMEEGRMERREGRRVVGRG